MYTVHLIRLVEVVRTPSEIEASPGEGSKIVTEVVATLTMLAPPPDKITIHLEDGRRFFVAGLVDYDVQQRTYYVGGRVSDTYDVSLNVLRRAKAETELRATQGVKVRCPS